jgi:hypothetical protein
LSNAAGISIDSEKVFLQQKRIIRTNWFKLWNIKQTFISEFKIIYLVLAIHTTPDEVLVTEFGYLYT